MRFILSTLLAAAAFWTLAPSAHADEDMRAMISEIVREEMGGSGLNARWDSGLRLDSGDGKFKMKLGGRIYIDHWFIDDEDLVGVGRYQDNLLDSGIDFRAVRLYNAGLIHGNVEFKLEIDFSRPNPSPQDLGAIQFLSEGPILTDAYIGLVNLDDCFGCLFPNIRVGHFKQPFGLERLTSLNHLTFMERSAATNTFTPGRKYGVMLHDTLMGDQFTWAVSYWLREQTDPAVQDDGDADFDNGHGFNARLTYTPWHDCDCACRRLHLGAGLIYVDMMGLDERFFAAPYVRDNNNPTLPFFALVDTGTMTDVRGWRGFNAELAFVYGPWSVQAEYFFIDVQSDPAGDPDFSGWYAQASYWLTGECRNYAKGKFGRVKPCCNFLDEECCCYGAFELAVRYDFIDLEDANVTGGEQSTLVVGLNWHLNPNTRLMFNYFLVDVEGGPVLGAGADESMSGLGIRFQVDW